MANTTTTSPNGASIVPDGTTDWILDQETNKHFILLRRIQFNPSEAGDRLVVRDGDANGRIIFDSDTVADPNDAREARYNGMRCIPFIDASECIFTTPSEALIMMDWDRTPF